MTLTLKRIALAAFAMGCALSFGLTAGHAMDAHQKAAHDYVVAKVKPWLSDKVLVDAINARNAETSKIKTAQLDQMDIDWIKRSDKKLIDSRMHNAASDFLRAKRDASKGAILEMFIFDKKGLNVAQTNMTGDFMQGDEAKYWKSYGAGPDAIFVDDVGPDGGKPHVGDVSVTIKDPKTGKKIGAITVTLDTDKL
jgi:hypothetical protein